MAAGCVRDLKRAHLLIATDDLAVRVLDGRDVALSERSPDEPQHQRALSDASRSEDDHPVVVALFRHHTEPHGTVLRNLERGKRTIFINETSANLDSGRNAILHNPMLFKSEIIITKQGRCEL